MAAGRIALLFPGQGSQYPGMGRELNDAFPEAREVFAEADQVLGFELSRLCFEGPEGELSLTENTQPAILAVSVAAQRVLAQRGVVGEMVAGHSLGEYSALVAAGALDLAVALDLVRKRGRYMQEAVPVGVGAMAAILGMEPKQLIDVCDEAARGEVVVPANFNSPEQTVVAGHVDAVRRAVALAEARGARRAILLPVSAPFHSPLMEPARQRLAQDLAVVTIRDLRVPLISNVDARPIRDAESARAALLRQVTAPVRWSESIERLREEGITRVIEVGPGKVLGGLVKRIAREIERFHVQDPASLAATCEACQ